MRFIIAFLATIVFLGGAAAEEPASVCDVPDSFLVSETDLTHVTTEIKDHQRLDISVIGTASSALPGPDGAHFAYPARLQDALEGLLPNTEIKVTAHVAPRMTTATMAAGLQKILTDDKPSLVIWQAGTADALQGVEPDDFHASLDSGLDTIQNAGADVILMNMQFSPRTESMLDVSAYADIMHWAAQQHGTLLFDRFGIMHAWNDQGTFDLYAAHKDYAMARKVHDCIGRALAFQIINAAHLDAERNQTTTH
jgi:hypothetical protein